VVVFALGTSSAALAGDPVAGDDRYHESCHACHGPAGKGAASYPKISGNPVQYTIDKLKAYRAGTKFGPNSGLMIMMAKPLTDEEIENLASYLKDAKYK
jgi:Cytochrome c553